MRGQLPDISPSSGAFRATFPPRGKAFPVGNHPVNTTHRVNRLYGFPLRGKLSPQVTDEGATPGRIPLIRRVPRHLPPKGEGFPGGQPSRQCNLTGKLHGTVKTVPYKPAGNLHFSQLLLIFRLFVGRGLDPSLQPCR